MSKYLRVVIIDCFPSCGSFMAGYQCTIRIITTFDDKSTIITTHDEPNYSTVKASPRGPRLSPAGPWVVQTISMRQSCGFLCASLRPPCVPAGSTRLSGGIGVRSRRPKSGVPEPAYKLYQCGAIGGVLHPCTTIICTAFAVGRLSSATE